MKQLAKREQQRITQETEQAIKDSSTLQEVHRFCTEVIPRPPNFVLVNKFKGRKGEAIVGYGYHADVDYGSVKTFFTDYLSQRGWQLTRQKEGGWGPPQIQFRNGSYQVTISDSGYHDDGINYFIECEKLSDSGVPTQGVYPLTTATFDHAWHRDAAPTPSFSSIENLSLWFGDHLNPTA